MILGTLVKYYDRLAADAESNIAPPGFSRQKISFEVVLKRDGTLVAFHDARIDGGGRMVPKLVVVPGQAKPSGSGLNPGFLWDSSQYVLGFRPQDAKPGRTRQAFEKFRERHLALEPEIGDEAFSAVCRFLRDWNPDVAANHKNLAEIVSAFGVFRIQGAMEYVHDRAKVRAYWLIQAGTEDDGPTAPSLITGEVQPIARLHEPKIKGVRGGQTSGATLVSFNDPAYESYGKSQSYNAPVGVGDAFKYCTALNRLTTARDRQVHLGDATVVFWTEKPTPFENEMFGLFEGGDTEDPATLTRLTGFFNRLRRAADGAPIENGDVPFYVLGLSPNAARVSVRFWEIGTVQQFAERLGRHLADLELSGAPPNMPPITLQRILDQTARERDEIPPLLGGAVLRAVLTGAPYPQLLCNSVLDRIRTDNQVNHSRAAVLKAFLIRNHGKEISKMLDSESKSAPYRLGRLFAVLERLQAAAHERDLNRSIRDGFFAAAAATPASVFPRLLQLHATHLRMLADRKGLQVYFERLVGDIQSGFEGNYPAFLPLQERGEFFIGYYHQRFSNSKDTENQVANKEHDE